MARKKKCQPHAERVDDDKPPHRTAPTVIKAAEVDVLMVPLVNWLNSFESIATLFSCQGEPAKKDGPYTLTDKEEDMPYVVFTCTNSPDLVVVLSVLAGTGKVEISWDDRQAQIRYSAHFWNQDRLIEAIGCVRRREATAPDRRAQ